MIDAYQATIIAGYGDGGFVKWGPDGIKGWGNAVDAWREAGSPYGEFDSYLEKATGYVPVSRFEIHEIESVNWEDVGHPLDFETSDIEYDYNEETATIKVDVSHLVGVFCEVTGERIE